MCAAGCICCCPCCRPLQPVLARGLASCSDCSKLMLPTPVTSSESRASSAQDPPCTLLSPLSPPHSAGGSQGLPLQPRYAPAHCHTGTKSSLSCCPAAAALAPSPPQKPGRGARAGSRASPRGGTGFSSSCQPVTPLPAPSQHIPTGDNAATQLWVRAGGTQALSTGCTSMVGQTVPWGLSLACPLPRAV